MPEPLPQTFFSQATGSECIVVNVCSGRRDVLANPFSQEIGSIGHDYSPDYAALASSFVRPRSHLSGSEVAVVERQVENRRLCPNSQE
jgi:hypothetical protein